MEQQAQSSSVQPGASSPTVLQTEYAGFGKRFVAAIVDGVLLSIFLAAFFSVLSLVLDQTAPGNNFFLQLRMLRGSSPFSGILQIAAYWMYFAGMESSAKKATIGKQLLGLVVTDESGKRISFLRASGRYFAKYLSGMLLLIGYLMVLFTKKKQGLHDILAGTLVLATKRPLPPGVQSVT